MSFLFRLLATPFIADRLIARAMKTPDEHLPGYMLRFWLFNPYNRQTRKPRYSWIPFSIRVHHILRADYGRDHHDHPWNARTVILRGWYMERRLYSNGRTAEGKYHESSVNNVRLAGDTATINFGEYHTIDLVSPGGVWTLFIMGRYRGNWGFMVDGEKVLHEEYEG